MTGISGFRLRCAKDKASVPKSYMPHIEPHLDAEALERLKSKIFEIGEGLLAMSEGDFNEWLDVLPRAEFYEWIGLGAEGIGAIISTSRRLPTYEKKESLSENC